MTLRNVLGVAFATVTIGAGVLVATPGVVLAHHPVLSMTVSRPCGADSQWSGTVTATSDADYNKNWQNKIKVGSASYSAYSSYTDDQVPYGPIAVGPFAANVPSVTVFVTSHWKNKSDEGGQITEERNITLYRPTATQCPATPTAGTWTPVNGTCTNPQGNLSMTSQTGAVYTGSPAGSYAPGASVNGSFTAAPGYVFQGNGGPFQHTFAVTDAPCQVPNNPKVTVTAVCGSWQIVLSNVVEGVDPWETVAPAILNYTVGGEARTLTAELGATVSDSGTVPEDDAGVTLVVNQATYVAGSDCVPNEILPPVLSAFYDCVSQTSSYTLEPAGDQNWTAGDVTLAGNTYSVTITPHEGFTFGDGANEDGTVTLTASFQVSTACEHTVAAPQSTPPTCTAPGAVSLPASEFYTWVTNQDGTYTAMANSGVRLMGSTTFGPFELAQLTGEQCVVPTIDLAAFSPVCQADTPYIQYEIKVSGTTAADATLTFFDLDGKQVAQYVDVAMSGRVVYPGASSTPPDWPGWKLNANGLWDIDPADSRLRDGLTVMVEVNPTATAQVAYPPATAACADPVQAESLATNTTVQIVQLPATGGGSNKLAALGTVLVLGGGALMFLVRRPRSL
jgi:LPXTG-motif cell wall-anchored protein